MTKPVTGLTIFGSNTSGTTTQLDNNFAALQNAINDFNTYANYLTDAGSANSVVVTLGANLTGALTDGLIIQVKIAATNTGASTLNYNSGGALNIINQDGSSLNPGQLQANGYQQFEYRSSDTTWILQTPFASGTEVLLSTVSANANVTIDFNSVLSSTYDNYRVLISNLVPACQNTNLLMRFAHSGANYIASASNYAWTRINLIDGGGATTATSNANASSIQVESALGNGTNNFFSGSVFLYGMANTTVFKGTVIDTVYSKAATFNVSRSTTAGIYNNSNNAIVSVRFLMSSGNISSGNISLYGIRK